MHKRITVVPTGKDLVDIVLSRTQRQTPTVVHKGYPIPRLRVFYMRKVKFTQQNYYEKLSAIIDEFPRLDNIHPFHADLLHVLYNKDHYKLALGQINTARNLISNISSHYVKLLKYGDSLYRCKSLKVAALGRMCNVIKRISPSLAYLEQVRQHMARLPSIDPNSRSILICGYPNVGKSSFMNKVTRADVAVEPYAFTTKSLFVGHTEYKYLRYQVIDTPGILDRPLEDRNVIEMCSITALAHLRAAVLFFVDISGSCGYTIAQQAALFDSIKPLFMNKPLIIVCSKTDLQPFDGLPEEEKALVMEMKAEAMKTAVGGSEEEESGVLLAMSTLTEEGVMAVKNAACARLLDQRVEAKMKSKKKMAHCLSRLHVAMPKPRGDLMLQRPPCSIPQAQGIFEKKTEKELEDENGGAGVYNSDLRKRYLMAEDEWKFDVIPEIIHGHNVADFYDPDIAQKVEELERQASQEEDREEELEMDAEILTAEEKEALRAIRRKTSELVQQHRIKKSTAESRPVVPRKWDKDRRFTAERMGRDLSRVGIDPSAALLRAGRRKRQRSQPDGDEEAMDVGGGKKKKLRAGSAAAGEGLKDSPLVRKGVKLAKRAAGKRNKWARKGEGDRVILNLKPKHLFSGKRGSGKTDRR